MADFETVCKILGELHANYSDSKDFKGFIEFNDLGLPLAFLTSEGLIVELSDDGRRYVIDTFDMFIGSLKVDSEYIVPGMTLDELLEIASSEQE
jgi:hypothetical protein